MQSPALAVDADPWGSPPDLTAAAKVTDGPVRRRNYGVLSAASSSATTSTVGLTRSSSVEYGSAVPGPSRRPSQQSTHSSNVQPSHPLFYPTPPASHQATIPDTRPALHRATSATERQLAESSRSGSEWGSARGSMDVLRMSSAADGSGGEVEVLIHTVKQHESLAGISLLYGIDLATLRKVNKLWASDPIHIRTHLYVPLEACRWNKAKETLVRGPGEGQVTLFPKSSNNKGKGKERASCDPDKKQGTQGLAGLPIPGGWGDTPGIELSNGDAAQAFMPTTNIDYEPPHVPSQLPPMSNGSETSISSPVADTDPTPRILDVVRIPSSQLKFFPRPKPPDTPHSSIDQDRSSRKVSEAEDIHDALRRASRAIELSDGPSIIPDLSTLPAPFLSPEHPHLPPKGFSARRTNSTTVRLRPPQPTATIQTGNTIANRLSSFFTVPPPPLVTSPISGPRSAGPTLGGGRPRMSIDSIASKQPGTPKSNTSFSASRRNSSIDTAGQRDEMELVTRLREGVGLGLGMGASSGMKGFGRKSIEKGKKGEKID